MHHDACEASNGIYEILENGKDRCSCFFKDDGEPYPCPEEFVCDSAHQRCVKCEEGKSFCVDGELHICLNGDWQKQPCESNTCLNKNSCAPTSLKPMCCKDANGNSICGELVSDNGILVVTGNAYALDECANGCENGECLPCNGFQTRCEEIMREKESVAQLTTCRNGMLRHSECSAKACNEDNTACKEYELSDNGCASEMTGKTICLNNKEQFWCDGNEWTPQMTCELGCNAEKTACAIQLDEPVDSPPCQEKKFKCEYDSANEAYHIYQCKDKVWKDLKPCPYGCVIDANTQEGYCKDKTDTLKCISGAYRCNENREICKDGVWVSEPCKEGEECTSGKDQETSCQPMAKCITGTYRCKENREICKDGVWESDPCDKNKQCVKNDESTIECVDMPCEPHCENTVDEHGRIVCANGKPDTTSLCQYNNSCDTMNNQCGECLNHTYQCKMSAAGTPELLHCEDGLWQSVTDESCQICKEETSTGKTISDVCVASKQNENCENGYYTWDETEKKIKLCANDEWVEDIPEYNKVFIFNGVNEKQTDFEIHTNANIHTGNISTDEQSLLKLYKHYYNDGNIQDARGFISYPLYFGCHDSLIFIDSGIMLGSFSWFCLTDDCSSSEMKSCTYGCNSNRTRCADDVAEAPQNGIFMSYYDTKEEPFNIELANKGKKFKETQCTSKGSLQYVCSGSDHQNALGNQFCIDAYDSKTYVRTSFQVEVQTNTATRKYKLTKCNSKNNTNRCNADWSACAVD